MLLKEFLYEFVGGLNQQKIEHCILRNYESLPDDNIGNDIDFLILPGYSSSAVDVIRAIAGVVITGFIERPCVTTIFVTGVSWGAGRNAIQIDLINSLCWKGLPYLSTVKVLDRLSNIENSGGLLKKTELHYEMLNTFFSSYLIGGWIKDKYQLEIRAVFDSERESISLALTEFLTNKVASELIDSVISDDRDQLLRMLPVLKRQLMWSRFYGAPIKSALAVFKHYFTELKVRYTPYPLDTICFLGPDGAGKSTVISAVIASLESSTKSIDCFHLKPIVGHAGDSSSSVEDPHSKPARSAMISVAKLLFWLVLYWKDRFFHGHTNLTLRIWDRYFYDVYIDPKRYRFGAPLWVAKLIGRLVPKPGLIIILSAPAEIIQARKQEVSLEETSRQCAAYIEFSRTNSNCIVLDTSVSIEETARVGRASILEYLAERQKKRMVYK